MLRETLLPAAAVLFAACSTPAENSERVRGIAQFKDDPRLGEQTDQICFASSIDGFSATTRDTVVVDEGGDSYIIEVFGSCLPLRDAQKLGFENTSCVRKGDRMIVSEDLIGGSGGPFDTQTCSIRSIYKWDPDKSAEAVKS